MIKVVDIENIQLPSLNKKYKIGRKAGKPILYLTDEYRNFKELISTVAVRPKTIQPPYVVVISFAGCIDIDNPLKPVLDGLQAKGIIGDDKDVLNMMVSKKTLKRGSPSSLTVWVGHLTDYDKEVFAKGV